MSSSRASRLTLGRAVERTCRHAAVSNIHCGIATGREWRLTSRERCAPASIGHYANVMNPYRATIPGGQGCGGCGASGAALASSGVDAWSWVSGNPAPYSGTLAHQSAVASGVHQHYFWNATATSALGWATHCLRTCYLNPANPPSEVLLQWNDGS